MDRATGDGPPAVRVLIVDDQRPFRLAVSSLLRRDPGFELVGEAESGEQAVELAASLHPDLVLMDITMPGIGGVTATQRILTLKPPPMVVLCSTYAKADRPEAAATSGAAAYVSKEELAPGVLRSLWEARSST